MHKSLSFGAFWQFLKRVVLIFYLILSSYEENKTKFQNREMEITKKTPKD
jgi:hypothetical protein